MIQTINPYASSRTAEIMSRYRPIAPKPETPTSPNSVPDHDQSTLPNGIRKSPYLRNVWAHLQSRPTRTRKRGRSAAFSPPPPPRLKRPRPCLQGLIPHPPPNYYNLVPLLRRPPPPPIDLNATAAAEEEPVLISPRPVRPVGSVISVESVVSGGSRRRVTAEEAEEMVEAERSPAIVTDSGNKVKMCNLAYKEMVGQPECGWLDCAGKRIGGEIGIRFFGESTRVEMMNGFRCAVRIEWEREGVKRCVGGGCEGVKLECEGKDFQFMWRFFDTNQ